MIVVVALEGQKRRAERITSALLQAGLDVQLRLVAPGAADWRADEQAVQAARCALFVWTRDAAASGAFCGLAAQAVRQGTAIGVQLGAAAVPPPGAAMTLYPLTQWQLGPPNPVLRFLFGDQFLRDVVDAARNKLAGMDPPPAASRMALMRRTAWGIVGGAASLIITGGGLVQGIGYIPLPHPQEDRDWAAIPWGTEAACGKLQAFVATYRTSDHLAEAQAALAHPGPIAVPTPRERRFPLANPPQLPAPRPDEASARADKAAELQAAAGRTCKDAAQNLSAKVLESRVVDPSLRCEPGSSGWMCVGDATAVCVLEEPVRRMVCQAAPRRDRRGG